MILDKLLVVVAQTTSSAGGGNIGSTLFCGVILAIPYLVSLWMIFEKAGEPGWQALIPIYNAYVLCRIVELPAWYILLLLIPVINLIALLYLSLELAKAFGKGEDFGCGLWAIPILFYLILAFDDSEYAYERYR